LSNSPYRPDPNFGLQTVPIALAKGKIDQERVKELEMLFEKYRKGTETMRTMLKSKIHRARVTDVNLNYEGSITIDRLLLEAAGLLSYERVEVFNINNGARFATYVIPGENGSGVICLNGAAARLAAKDDLVIILSYSQTPDSDAANIKPRIVCVDCQNKIILKKEA
jgi:aspartate 1-decarboxylase